MHFKHAWPTPFSCWQVFERPLLSAFVTSQHPSTTSFISGSSTFYPYLIAPVWGQPLVSLLSSPSVPRSDQASWVFRPHCCCSFPRQSCLRRLWLRRHSPAPLPIQTPTPTLAPPKRSRRLQACWFPAGGPACSLRTRCPQRGSGGRARAKTIRHSQLTRPGV